MANNADDLVISVSGDISPLKRHLTQLGQDITATTSKISNQFQAMGLSVDKSFTPMQRRINDMVGIPYTGKVKEWSGALAGFGTGLDKVSHSAGASSPQMQAMMHATRSMTEQLALGVSPIQALVGQIGHLSFVASQPGGITGSLKKMGEGALSLITKFPYVTAAIAAAGVAFVAYEMIGGKTVASVDDALSEHQKSIKALREAYGLAGDGAEDYARRSVSSLESAQRRSLAALRESVMAAEKQAKADLSDNGGFNGFGLLQRLGLLGDSDLSAVNARFAAFAEPIRKLREDIKAGKPDFDAFQQALDRIAATDPGRLRPIADEISGVIDKAARGREEIDNMSVALNGLTQSQIDTAHIAAQIANIETAAKDAQGAVGALKSMLASMDRLGYGEGARGDAIGGKGSLDRAQASYNDQLALWRRFGHDKDVGLQKPDPKKGTKSKTPSLTADDQFSNDLQSIKDRTAALKEELNTLGLSYEAQQKRKISLQLEQTALKQVREEARKKGNTDWENAQLTPDQIKKIDAVSAAYAKQAEQLKEAQAAQQLQRDVLQGVFDDLRTSLEAGQLSWKTFGDIAIHVLDKVIAKIETDLIDSIMQANSAAGGGGGIFGSVLGMLTGGGGGGTSSSFGTPGGFAQMLGIPGYANGTSNHPGGLAIVGERGPELLNLPRGSQVIPRVPSMPAISSGGRGGSVAVNNNITVDARGAQQGVGEEIRKALAAYDAQSVPRTVTALRTAKTRGLV